MSVRQVTVQYVGNVLRLLDPPEREVAKVEIGGRSYVPEDSPREQEGGCWWVPIDGAHGFAGPAWACSSCGYEVGEYEHDQYAFCPKCGATIGYDEDE